MAFLGAFVTSAVKFVIYLAIIVGACICGARLKDRKKAKDSANE
ncbi:MAG: hypothetical protein PUG60_06675 [Lachnospiraceae bacterium]|nr:hypothetical protein [Lachnospiraceae bacterium]MDY4969481.1 hypothetical protein [Lachnospiraceae bacterium]